MEYAVAAGGIGISDILQKMSANPWVIAAIVAVVIVIYFVIIIVMEGENILDTVYTSNELFHFVGHADPNNNEINFNILKNILTDRCVSHPPHENNWGKTAYTVNWDRSLADEELIVPMMTCYADIPKESLGIHVKKYGKFGLSFSRDLLAKYHARPVMYVPTRTDDCTGIGGTVLLNDIEAVFKGFHKIVASNVPSSIASQSRRLGDEPENEYQAIQAIDNILLKDLLGYIKPFNSMLDISHPDNYYMEREWRMYGNLKFTKSDIQTIVIAKGFHSMLSDLIPDYKGNVIEI